MTPKKPNKAEQLRRDYAYIFNTEQGQRVLTDILKHAHVLEPSFVSGDPHETAFREGERNAALRILTILRWSEIDINRLSQEVVSHDNVLE